MSIRRILPLSLAAVALAAAPFAASAQSTSAAPTIAGWSEFVESLRTLPDRMLAKLPEAQRSDPQMQQEVVRLALEAVASQTLDAIGSDGDAPQFMPSIGQVLNIGQPNADTIYRSATIAPGGTYRITGKQGNVSLAVISQNRPPTDPGQGAPAFLNLASLKADAQGRFSVLVSAARPADYTGDWWKLEPGVAHLMVRMVSSDWDKEVEPTLAIERTDKPIGRPRPPAALLEQRLRALPRKVDFSALMFVDRVENAAKKGVLNKVEGFTAPYSALQGQFYYEGAYKLADDEALILESPVPAKCDYRSIILTNAIYETTDWYNNHSSLNAAQAAPDADGKLRFVISARDPGVKNWLDTAGYAMGMIQGRWTGCDSQPIPSVRLVKFKDVIAQLPKGIAMVTPEQRQQILRERRRQLLERPLW